MGTLLHHLQDVSPVAAGLLIASIWEGMLLTAGVALVLRMLHGLSAASRSMAWAGLLVLLLLLPALLLLGSHPAMAAHPATAAPQAVHVSSQWSLVLVTVWAVFSLYRGLGLAIGAFRLRRLALRAVPVATPPEVAKLLRVGRRKATLCVSPEVNRPSVAGFLAPRILLPSGMMESLSASELQCVVLHEMEHLRRHDDWMNLLQQVSLALLPLNPALFWLDRRLCQERELACDDGVLRATRAHRAYAACLVKLAEESLVRKGLALALSALGTRARESELVGRVRRILRPSAQLLRGEGRRPWALASVGVVALLAMMGLKNSPELVRFDAVPAFRPQLAIASAPASAGKSGPAFRSRVETTAMPVLASAVLGATSPRLHAATMVLPPRRYLKARATRRNRPVPQQPTVEWKATVQDTASLPGPSHMVLTEIEFSQPVYAAVPLRGGWLILQL